MHLLRSLTLLLTILTALPATTTPPYVVLASQQTAAQTDWKEVIRTLLEKHQATLITYTESPKESLPHLQQNFPHYVALVAQPTEVSRQLVVDLHQLARQLDDDPYTDFFWGIVTGYSASNALTIARETAPLTIRKVAAGTELAMDMVEEGLWFCELNRNKMIKKEAGKKPAQLQGPTDTTQPLVDSLNTYQPDLFVTSGHATEHDWQIGFRYKNGYFKHNQGKLYGLDTQGNQHPVQSPNPKVYLPVGNCLMGHIDQTDCMATSWMNSAGVRQMPGYIQPTWYGYMGWGILDYFVEQPGRYSLSEAFFANHHALMHRLLTYFPEAATLPVNTSGRPAKTPATTTQAKAAKLTPMDALGLLFDRDMVAFYGDPAWDARLAPQPLAYHQSLTITENHTYELQIHPQRGHDSFAPINTNGSQRGGRPFVAFLPHRIANPKIVQGAELQPVITDNFILIPNPLTCDPEKTYTLRFTAEKL